VLSEIKNSLNTNSRVILQAPPGAGKSTKVPLSLLDSPWLCEKMIIMLEPRRVAARMVAFQMAKNLGEEIGQSVGYQIKMDSSYSKETKILVVTEAILVRMLQADETLQKVALIIFDEFHERSIHSDLSLALSLQVQELIREDLKILIMSATLNTQKLTALLENAVSITSEGRSYEVENIYLNIKTPQPDRRLLNQTLLKIILKALRDDKGDILVFLQGVKEIQRLQKSLIESLKNENISVLPLYSALPKKEQDRAILTSPKRKIILSTNIAQTSLTIEGVRVVVDSGLEKLSRYDYSNAMNHLETRFISKDSATQRAGRAGRLSSGKCYRVWHEHKVLQTSTDPEILRLELSSLLLDLALWGVKEFDELSWLDLPKREIVAESRALLISLEMLESDLSITAFGREAIALGVHPRFAYMILKANEKGCAYEASLLSAMLLEGDIFKNSFNESDILARFMHLYEKDIKSDFIHYTRAKEVLKQAEFFYTKLKKITKIGLKRREFEPRFLGVLLLLAYPDRLAKRRVKNDNRYKLSNAKGAILNREDRLFNEEYLVVPSLNANAKDSYIREALAIFVEDIRENFSDLIRVEKSLKFNKDTKKFDLRETSYFLAVEIDSKALQIDKKYNMGKLFLELIREEGLSFLTWNKKALSLRDRVNFINEKSASAFEDFSERGLLNSLERWLEPFMLDIKSVKDLESLNIYDLLLNLLTWEQQQELERLAPLKIKVPSGSNIYIDYSDINRAVLKVKIQEMFGLEETPKILNGEFALQVHLLSPAMREIQITYDLSSFWKNSYDEVRKELRGKYKRHYWPINPYEAVATKKTKKNLFS